MRVVQMRKRILKVGEFNPSYRQFSVRIELDYTPSLGRTLFATQSAGLNDDASHVEISVLLGDASTNALSPELSTIIDVL